jgi:parallel beta helix pectate lyase-like protein
MPPRLPMMRRPLLALLLLGSPSWAATTYYVGAFTTCARRPCPPPVDDATCGTVHPCASLAYFVSSNGRNMPAVSGDTVRLFGNFTSCGRMCDSNCIPFRTGITWEGRTADDLQVNAPGCGGRPDVGTCDYGEATVHAELTIGHGPCAVSGGAGGIVANEIGADDGIVRDLTINGGVASVVFPRGTKTVANPKFQRIKFTGQRNAAGLILGANDATDPPCSTNGRRTTNAVVDDCEFTDGGGNNGGLWLGCVDGFHVSRNYVHDLAIDGLHLGAAINGTMTGNVVVRNAGDGVDVSGNGTPPDAEAGCHDIVFEDNELGDNATAPLGTGNLSINHANYAILVRNNLFHGAGPCIHLKGYPGRIRIYNNTCFMNDVALRAVTVIRDVDIENNVFIGGGTSQSSAVLSFRDAAFNPSVTLKNNVLRSGGPVLGQNTDIGPSNSAPTGCRQDPVTGTDCFSSTRQCNSYAGSP